MGKKMRRPSRTLSRLSKKTPQNAAQHRRQFSGTGTAAANESSVPRQSRDNMELNLNNKTASAPTSPAKGRESLLQRVQSLTGVARDQGASLIGAVASGASTVRQQAVVALNKDKCYNLLVIDNDSNADWVRSFRGKRIQLSGQGEYEIRVEQTEFKDVTLVAGTDAVPVVSLVNPRSGGKSARSYRPDFLLIKQNLQDCRENHKNVLLAFMLAGIPSVNSMISIYNFQDKPWVFAHLLQIQKRVGKDNFPLLERTFYPNTKDVGNCGRFPAVVKIGQAHHGAGKIKVDNQLAFQEICSVVAEGTYVTVEPFVEAKYDLHVQKIGDFYRGFTRKSVCGNWKTNVGSSVIEQVPLDDHHRQWMQTVSGMFGGLEMCELEILVDRQGNEHIYDMNDGAFTLMGDTTIQEDDRKRVADVVIAKIQTSSKPPLMKSMSRTSIGGSQQMAFASEEAASSPQPVFRRDSQGSQDTFSFPDPAGGEGALKNSGRLGSTTGSVASVEDYEDTMKNLRKTFAGIFGDDK